MLNLDYRQFQCPHPVVETRKQLLANPGQTLQVRVADEIACENLSRLASSQNYQFAQQVTADGFLLTLTPSQVSTEVPNIRNVITSGKSVIFCGSELMGSGDVELGHILLKNFFVTLTEVTTPPDTILFVNSGVKLVCQGSEALEALTSLACNGVDIAACGLCLDFYQLKEKLQIGRTTNMLEIAETCLQATRVITP